MKPLALVGLVALARLHGLVAAAPFTNLNFESAILPFVPEGQVGEFEPSSEALPGWTVFVGPDPVDLVLHNNALLGTAVAIINGPDSLPSSIFEGNYTVVLVPGASPFNGASVGVSIEQTGLVPANALSFQFFGRSRGLLPATERFGVFINGQELDAFTLASGPKYDTFGVDVSAFADQEVALRITSFRLPSEPNALRLDALTFSPVAVPEPGIFGLLTLAGLAFGFHRWRNSRK